MLCADVMKRAVQTIAPEESVQAAALRMRDAEASLLAVCDDLGRVSGVVTDRDLVRWLCAAGSDPVQTPVARVMTRGVITCSAMDELQVAEELMIAGPTDQVIVVDDRERLAGIIRLSDVARRAPAAEALVVVRMVASR
jgi:CBS domain-containing protein